MKGTDHYAAGKALAVFGALALAGGLDGPSSPNDLANGVTPRRRGPWWDYDLTKAQRRGLSPDQVDALRKRLWEESRAGVQSGERATEPEGE